MRLIVFFDLPVQTKKQRSVATKFRNFLLKDGYYMMQFSVYVRICSSYDNVALHKQRLKNALPENGSIKLLVITEKQYENIDLLLGNYVPNDLIDSVTTTII